MDAQVSENRTSRIDVIGQNGNDGLAYCPHLEQGIEDSNLVEVPALFASKQSPYHHQLFPGVWIDVYAVLETFPVTDAILQHLIKKALQPGLRGAGHKSKEQDYKEILWSAQCALDHYCNRQKKDAANG